MNFDDQQQARERAGEFPEPNKGDRICEECVPRVALVLDLSKPGYEYRCPKCGTYDEWFGLRYLPKAEAAPQHRPTKEGKTEP